MDDFSQVVNLPILGALSVNGMRCAKFLFKVGVNNTCVAALTCSKFQAKL